MKKIVQLLTIFSLLVTGLASCSQETPLGENAEQQSGKAYEGTFTLKGITYGPKTYAEVPAEPKEKNLTKLSVMVFSATDNKYLGTVDAELPTPIGNTEEGFQAKFDVESLAGGISPFNIKFLPVGNLSAREVNGLLATINPITTELTYAQVKAQAKVVYPHSPDKDNEFVMLANEKIPDEPYAAVFYNNRPTYIYDNIVLRRLSAKINVVLEGANLDDITIRGVTVTKRIHESNLFELTASLDPANSDTKGYEPTSTDRKKVEHKIYMYENSKVSDTKLSVALVLGDVELTPIEIDFDKGVKRNHIYTVKISRDPNDGGPGTIPEGKPRFTWTIDVNDWNTGAVIPYEDYANSTNAPVIYNITSSTTNVTAADPWKTAKIGVIAGNTSFTVFTDSKSTEADAKVITGNDWLTLTGKDIHTYATEPKGALQQEFYFEATPNNTGAVRTGKIKFYNKLNEDQFVELEVTQSHSATTVEYTLTVTPTTHEFEASGGDLPFTVEAKKITTTYVDGVAGTPQEEDISTAFTATPSETWLTIAGTKATAQKNMQKTDRTAIITIALNDSPATKKAIQVSQKKAPERKKMAIEYLAEYNVAADGKSFATSHRNDASGYFSLNDLSKFSAITINQKGYHLPSRNEWHGLFTSSVFYSSSSSTPPTNVSEEITVKGDNKTYFADYKKGVAGISYGLRFKKASSGSSAFPAARDNSMLCAFRYEYVNVSSTLESHLKITCRYLGEDFSGNINTIAKEDYWTTNSDNDKTAIFPISGYYYYSSSSGTYSFGYRGTTGTYWFKPTANYCDVYFGSTFSYSIYTTGQSTSLKRNIRLFLDE